MESNSERIYEEEVCEEPVDYSKKYTERKVAPQNHLMEDSPRTERSCKNEFSERDSKVDLFGDYAETDLDQPTDYSLRYAEDDTDDDEKQTTEYFSGSIQEDTVKTYCTEGTPYETPLNFSTATSMSDLRLEDSKEIINPVKKPMKKVIEISHKENLPLERTHSLNCDNKLSIPVQKEPEPSKKDKLRSINDRTMPHKIIEYYQAETPDGLSRANSLSSVGGVNTQRNNITVLITKTTSADSEAKGDTESERASHSATNSNSTRLHSSEETDSSTEGKSNSRVMDKEGKMVTFSRQDFYAEQTPLMFSRCSSLGSLSGFEQHSIHDDRSSIISDFSRRTSGIVSPSELPDSPTQGIPPSPRHHKSQCGDFIRIIQEEAIRPSVRHLSYSKSQLMKSSVFEDDIATFKEESTPIEFSTTTSLSSLTIDDEANVIDSSKQRSELEVTSSEVDENTKLDTPGEKTRNAEVEKDQEQVSDGDEDDEDMLAACISIGMQNNRYRQSFKTPTTQTSIQSDSSNILVRYQRPTHLKRLDSCVSVTTVDTSATNQKAKKTGIEVVAAPDTVHVYCTENTPADISPVGSHSNLSVLSMSSIPGDIEKIEGDKSSNEVECRRNDLSDESSNLSGEDEKILDECIQSGMPKIRQITPPPTGCIPCTPKTEGAMQRFNKCETPSSSPVESGNKNCTPNKPQCRAEMENELSDDSPNHSDDEAILSECIRSAMPKIRVNISTLRRPALPSTIEKPNAMTMLRSSTSLSYLQPKYAEQNRKLPKKFIPFEDNHSLSEGEEDIILAQCIKSGMPKAVKVSTTLPFLTMKNQSNEHLKPQINSGCSSFELLNKCYSTKMVTGEQENMIENILSGSRPPGINCRSPITNVLDHEDEEQCCNIIKSNGMPSRQSTVSSLSEEGSLGSIEEWALLELCISSGIPRNKYHLKAMKSAETNSTISNNKKEDRDLGVHVVL